MSERRFDAVARSLANATSRRKMLKVLVGGALGGFGLTLGRTQVLAQQAADHDDRGDDDDRRDNPH
ncbi:MAG: hypothetical protein ACYDCQ_14725, partial [Dehalococcoidia bacterium]